MTVPLVGWSSAPMSDSSDVLPEPDGPVSATNSPGSSVSETSDDRDDRPRVDPGHGVDGDAGALSSAMDLDRIVEVHAPFPRTRKTTRSFSGKPTARAGHVNVPSRMRPVNGYGVFRHVPAFEHAEFGSAFGLG